MTDKAGARKAVLLSAGALLVIAVYRNNKGADVNLYRRVWGVSVMALMLAALADFAPGIAGPFAVLTVMGSLTHGGDAAIQNLLGGLSSGGGLYGTTGPVGGGTAPAAKTTSPTAKVPGETLPPGAQGPQG